MRMLTVSKNEAGQRLDKLLAKYLNLAGKSFIYKMMRKKNITLNGKKCDGSEHLTEGDEIKLFLAEETIEKFSEVKIQKVQKKKLDIVYEDEHILLINKPSGMLSQKAKETDESLVEYLIDYLLDSGKLKKEDLACFRPSVCNRLDRNTSGIVAAGRSLPGLQIMSEVIKDRSLGKYYVCVVRGIVKGEARIEGWLTKNEKTNQVSIRKEETPGSLPIRTAYRPLVSGNGYTLLEVHLITGRSHQIRAHLASIGHPIAGDPKYGDPRVNEEVKKRFGVPFADASCVAAGNAGNDLRAAFISGGQRIYRAYAGGDEADGNDDEISSKTPSQSSPVNFKLWEKLKNEWRSNNMGTWNSRGLRGSTLEDMINHTNDLYREKKLALIQKIPTPITPVSIDKSSRHITLAYFDQKSTVDYIGAIQGVPVCFDAKECAADTFPLQNVHPHQVAFMREFEEQGGIAFLIIYFSQRDELYYLPFFHLDAYWERMQQGGRKSFTYEEMDKTWRIKSHRDILVHYLEPLSRDLGEREDDFS